MPIHVASSVWSRYASPVFGWMRTLIHICSAGIYSTGKRDVRKRAAIHHKPREEGAGLVGREHVHLEHGHRVGADGPVEQLIDAELRAAPGERYIILGVGMSTYLGELASDALVQLHRVLGLIGRAGMIVNWYSASVLSHASLPG